jgi:hypothetical protein
MAIYRTTYFFKPRTIALGHRIKKAIAKRHVKRRAGVKQLRIYNSILALSKRSHANIRGLVSGTKVAVKVHRPTKPKVSVSEKAKQLAKARLDLIGGIIAAVTSIPTLVKYVPKAASVGVKVAKSVGSALKISKVVSIGKKAKLPTIIKIGAGVGTAVGTAVVAKKVFPKIALGLGIGAAILGGLYLAYKKFIGR